MAESSGEHAPRWYDNLEPRRHMIAERSKEKINLDYMHMQLPIQIFKLTHLQVVISGKTCDHYKIFSPLQNGLLLLLALKC